MHAELTRLEEECARTEDQRVAESEAHLAAMAAVAESQALRRDVPTSSSKLTYVRVGATSSCASEGSTQCARRLLELATCRKRG